MPQSIEHISRFKGDEREPLEQNDLDGRQHSRIIGSKLLTMANFDTRNKVIVDSSFNKARTKGEKLPGKNNERRNYSYVKRLEDLVDKHGNEFEKRLWKKSSEKLIIDEDDIPESYWKTQEQILRDNGQGRQLTQYEKDCLVRDVQEQQKKSLEQWVNYLGDEQSPYPLWFKVYAWDGMSKMGTFDTNKKEFAKRDKSTVAPYPKLNAAALAKLYGAISKVYGISDEARYDENEESDSNLDNLVKSGNFNKLYSKLLLDTKTIVKTPERTEDVHGEWREYLPGEEEALATAAEGTPWCVADPGTGRSYLEHGVSYNNEDEEDSQNEENGAKFILFHLTDPETGVLADNACASIRLDTDGDVAEISGLKEGQALEDALVPIVEEKVRTLPGGEKFLKAFADKKKLIELDHKMQEGKGFAIDDLFFIFEIKRPIETLDSYNNSDPRLKDLRNTGKLLEAGTNPTMILALFNFMDSDSKKDSDLVGENLSQLLESGANVNEAMEIKKFNPWTVAARLDELLEHGANINVDSLVEELSPQDILRYLDSLLAHGASANLVAQSLEPHKAVENFDKLREHGANVNINDLVEKLTPFYARDHVKELLDLGTDANLLVKKFDGDEYYKTGITHYINQYLEHGVDIKLLTRNLDASDIKRHLNRLLPQDTEIDVKTLMYNFTPITVLENNERLQEYGVEVNINTFSAQGILEDLDELRARNANIDIDNLVKRLSPSEIMNNFEKLQRNGANLDINELAKRLDPRDIAKHLETLQENGIDIDITELTQKLQPGDTIDNLEKLQRNGANINPNEILAKLGDDQISWHSQGIIDNIEAIQESGIDVKRLIEKLALGEILDNFDKLLRVGEIDIDNLARRIKWSNVKNWKDAKKYDSALTRIRELGADI